MAGVFSLKIGLEAFIEWEAARDDSFLFVAAGCEMPNCQDNYAPPSSLIKKRGLGLRVQIHAYDSEGSDLISLLFFFYRSRYSFDNRLILYQ
jgi:hypothetical protein